MQKVKNKIKGNENHDMHESLNVLRKKKRGLGLQLFLQRERERERKKINEFLTTIRRLSREFR
jgi:ABC-type uncharacterized transport system ATPase subunit